MPHIINLLLARSSEPVNLERQASRSQLQQGAVYGSHPIFKTVAEAFHDPHHNSGGLAGHHEVFEDYTIDPEQVEAANAGSKITPKQVYKYYRDAIALYKRAYENYYASGLHDDRDFWSFCNGKTDVLYVHIIAVIATKNEQILQFMSQGRCLDPWRRS